MLACPLTTSKLLSIIYMNFYLNLITILEKIVCLCNVRQTLLYCNCNCIQQCHLVLHPISSTMFTFYERWIKILQTLLLLLCSLIFTSD